MGDFTPLRNLGIQQAEGADNNEEPAEHQDVAVDIPDTPEQETQTIKKKLPSGKTINVKKGSIKKKNPMNKAVGTFMENLTAALSSASYHALFAVIAFIALTSEKVEAVIKQYVSESSLPLVKILLFALLIFLVTLGINMSVL